MFVGCLLGVDSAVSLALVYANSGRCDRPHKGPHACDEDAGRRRHLCPLCQFPREGSITLAQIASQLTSLPDNHARPTLHLPSRPPSLLQTRDPRCLFPQDRRNGALPELPRLPDRERSDQQHPLRDLRACHHSRRARPEEIHEDEAAGYWPTYLACRIRWGAVRWRCESSKLPGSRRRKQSD